MDASFLSKFGMDNVFSAGEKVYFFFSFSNLPLRGKETKERSLRWET